MQPSILLPLMKFHPHMDEKALRGSPGPYFGEENALYSIGNGETQEPKGLCDMSALPE